MAIRRGNDLGKALIEEGLCPPNCSNVELHIPATGVMTLRYDVFVDTKDIPKLQRALGKLIEDQPEGFAGLPDSEQPTAGKLS